MDFLGAASGSMTNKQTTQPMKRKNKLQGYGVTSSSASTWLFKSSITLF